MRCRRHEFVLAATGVSVGKRQLEQIVQGAAADAERFCQDPGRARDEPVLPVTGQEGNLPPLGLSADGKGVAMLPGTRRRTSTAPDKRARNFRKRTGTGEKAGHKRMAGTGCVFDVAPPGPGRPGPDPGAGHGPRSRHRPERAAGGNRWYACDITAGREVTTGKVPGEAGRRDPGRQRTWIALAGGDSCQLGLIRAQAAARDVTVTTLTGFIHVLRYLWKAAWCFHAPRDPAMKDRVTAQATGILHGQVAEVITRIARLAGQHPPRPGSEHAKIIRTALPYLDAKQDYMDCPRALASGWPIAAGVIEGACRHLAQDQMGITGARRGLDGAQAMLWLRAIDASGDTAAYRDWPITQEHQRNHLSRYKDSPGPCQDGLGLAA
ncbi:MAG TPA: hypothetical protein VFQ68_04765 [Streptosporangiaceae bacterium]|nr:hypothetical protein [Streptosporangiaceae bacterium]